MNMLYQRLADSFKAEWQEAKVESGTTKYLNEPKSRLFHNFLFQEFPRREVELEFSQFGVRSFYFIQGAFDMWPSILIEQSDTQNFILNTIQGEAIETDCLEFLQDMTIKQLKVGFELGIICY